MDIMKKCRKDRGKIIPKKGLVFFLVLFLLLLLFLQPFYFVGAKRAKKKK